MKNVIMIQARCGSTRLPNKVMKDLCGKTTLQQLIERAQRSKLSDEVIVVTSIGRENLPILNLCASMGVRVGVGSEDDVLDRYYQTAKLLKPEIVIRLTADCPCFDPELLDLALVQMEPDTDYMGMITESFADGLDLEIITYAALERSWREANHSFEREHITQYVKRHPELFKLLNFESPIGYFGDQRWTVDEPEDFELVRRVFEHFQVEEGRNDFSYKDILTFLKAHPEITDLNKNIARNEGLAKSIREDHMVYPEW